MVGGGGNHAPFIQPACPFGSGDKIDPYRALVGALIGLSCLGLLAANGCPPETIQETKLLASDGGRGDWFGNSISVSGKVAVVGAVYDDDNGYRSGSAYVFSNLGGTPACSDGIDNDSDGLTDLDDAGCAFALDTSEQWGLPCIDEVDNDDDGLIDFPADPGCADVSDRSEKYDCYDGSDNDSDGLIDYFDPGCDDASDSSEKSPLLVCDDGIDNDSDEQIDYPDDVGCTGPSDLSEEPDCMDALDNDGLVDHPADPGCHDPEWFWENPQCKDGIDNDGDSLIDFDGGLLVLGYAVTDPDPQCVGEAWRNTESACGLGWELGPVLASLMLLARRRRRSRRI